MALNNRVDEYLVRQPGVAYSTSGASATCAASNLDAAQLKNLIEVASAHRHEVVLVAGVLTIRPR
jgi:hypothetical protein